MHVVSHGMMLYQPQRLLRRLKTPTADGVLERNKLQLYLTF